MVPSKDDSRGSFRTTGLACVAIVLAALAVYSNSFSGPFIYDDVVAITENPTIRHLWPVWRVLSPPGHLTVSGRPLINLSLALNYALSGDAVWSYHAVNLLIHILAGLALFGIVRRTILERPTFNIQRSTSKANPRAISPESRFAGAATPLALTVALLWVVHPLQTECVTYVIQRTESLMGLFYLLTLYCFVRGVEAQEFYGGPSTGSGHSTPKKVACHERRPKAGVEWFAASILSCLLGMASKEVMVSAPLMVLLYDRTFVAGSFRAAWQQRRKLYLGLAATWLLLGYLVATTGDRGGSAGFGDGISERTYALTQFRAIVHYLRLSVWPQPLVFDYGRSVLRQVAEAAPYAAIILTLVILTVVGLWRNRALGFLGAWFFAILAPSSSVVPVVTETMAEHRMYLALAAVITVIVFGLYALLGRRSVVIGLALAVGLGVLTARRNEDYRSELAIWSDTVAKCPDNPRAHNNLGDALMNIPGQLSQAIFAYEAAVRIDPNFSVAHNNLGCVLANIPGRWPEAISHFETVFRIAPGNAKARNNLGIILYKAGRTSEAMIQFEAAVRIKPDYAEAHRNLGIALDEVGRIPEAAAQFKQVVRIDPDNAEAHNSLGIILDKAGRMPEAIAQFEEAVRIDPNGAEVHKNLSIALGKVGRIPEAIDQCQEVLRIKPDSADARAFLVKLQNAAGR
ncbi:MAG TPA: tetratricopeptide repeat protein [Opitutaceae bacterium]|nr:tetratricopeptide repeat protein [Opitutaceae bacterium]